jgi:hypothetical protein
VDRRALDRKALKCWLGGHWSTLVVLGGGLRLRVDGRLGEDSGGCAWVQVDEPAGLQASKGSVDAAIATAKAQLAAGQLSAAAAAVEQAVEGTAAVPAVAEWVAATRARAVIEQTVALLRAHSMVLAARRA